MGVITMPISLAQLREEHGLTQEQLASKLGVARRAVGMWEQGLRTPRYDTAKRAASLFGISMAELQFASHPEQAAALDDPAPVSVA